MIEAACAYYECCGDERFLNIMKKYADHIYKIFVDEKSSAFLTPGHQEIELALIRLYKATNEKKYLGLCMFFLNTRGTETNSEYLSTNSQSHLPVREQKEAVGHSVRALYLYCAMADAALQTNDKELYSACLAIFDDIINYKMHITGGLGQTHVGEAFTIKYDLKNELAYTETCASIAMVMFCERLFEINHLSTYADIIERELYNGIMSGLSLSGKEFFYTNPLEIDLKNHEGKILHNEKPVDWLPITQRPEIFGCSCCPPNVTRTLASLERLIYYRNNNDIYINQFAESKYKNNDISLVMTGDYLYDGKLKVSSKGIDTIFVRIPWWCDKFKISAEYELVDGYAKVCDDEFEIEFEITTKYIMSNENVSYNANKIAVMRGPVVYCAEGIDNNVQLHRLYIDTKGKIEIEKNEHFGLPIISIEGFLRTTTDELYSELNDEFEKTKINLIPYYGFANRGESDMRVWLSYK